MRKILPVLILCLVLTGCGTTYYHPRYPILEVPDRPQLENISGSELSGVSAETKAKLVGNQNKSIDHIKKLEAAIETYNEYATEQNEVLDNISDKKED